MAQGVFVITEQRDNAFRKVSFEAVSEGRRIADGLGADLTEIVVQNYALATRTSFQWANHIFLPTHLVHPVRSLLLSKYRRCAAFGSTRSR